MSNIIIGCGGQDGQSLSEYLLELGEIVVGVVRRSSQPRDYLKPLVNKGLKVIEGDMEDLSSMCSIFRTYRPKHIYALGAMSHVGTSFEQPHYTFDVVAKGILNVLEAMRIESPESKMYNAASSEMFGSNYSLYGNIYDDYYGVEHYDIKQGLMKSHLEIAKLYGQDIYYPFQDESTPMSPNSPYGVGKLAAFHMTRLYRESYGLFASSGILFNHDSKYRSITFATRKITHYVSRLRLAKEKGAYIEKLKMGNLDTFRDLTDASDMVRGMNMILNYSEADDFVLGSGKTYSIREFAKQAFEFINEDYNNHIEIDPSLFRPREVEYLCSRPEKVYKILGWKPEISFDELVKRMVHNDIERTNIKYSTYGDI